MAGDISILNGPLELWFAPTGTAFPGVDDDPSLSFTLIGSSGDKSYTEDGVVVSIDSTTEEFTPLGGVFPRRAFITNRSLAVTVTLADLSLDQVRLAFNQNVVTTNVNDREISLDGGVELNCFALLIRGTGKSPEVEGDNMQFELFQVREAGSQEITFVKGEPAGVALEFLALDDPTNGVGVLRAGI